MRKLLVPIILFVLLSTALSYAANPAKEPQYSSEKPLYAQVVLDEKGTKLLTLVFDESKGTGKGYDTMYPDLNLNGDLTDDKATKGSAYERGSSRMSCSFSPIAVHALYNEKAKGVERPWQIVAHYSQYQRSRLFGLIKGQISGTLSLQATMRLKDEAGVWGYSWYEFLRAKDQAGTKPIAFGGKPTLQVETRPDRQKKGNTGIAATLATSAELYRCTKDNKPVTAHVRVTNEQGKVVHSEDVGLDKLAFG